MPRALKTTPTPWTAWRCTWWLSACGWVAWQRLLLVARQLGGQLSVVAGRYSTLAGCCFVVVAGSGLINAMLRLDSVSNLATGTACS